MVDLSDRQRDAILKLGETASGHDFIEPDVLNELLALELVYWRGTDDLDFTKSGEELLNKLAGG